MAAATAESPFDLGRIATYLSLPQTILAQLATTNEQVQSDETDPRQNLLLQLLTKVDERAREELDTGNDANGDANGSAVSVLRQELMDIKAERMVEQVNHENRTHALSTRVKFLESQLTSFKAREDKAKNEIEKLQSETITLHTQLSEVNTAYAQAQTELEQLRRQLSNIENDRGESMVVLERKTEEVERVNDEYRSVVLKLQEAKRENSALQTLVQETKVSEQTSKFQQQSAEQELVLVRQQSDWLNKELGATTEEFMKYRKEKSVEITKLQSDLDSAQSAANASQTSANLATRRLEEQTSKYEDALLKVKELSDRLVVDAEGFKSEMTTQQRLAALWERSANDNKAQLQILEERLRNSERQATMYEEEANARVEQARGEAERLAKILEEAETTISRLRIELKGANEMLTEAGLRPGTPASSNGTRGSAAMNGLGSVLSPIAAVASRFQKSGKTFTEVYSENVTLTQQNGELQAEKIRLSGVLRDVLLEIEERAPVMQEQRREYDRVNAELEEISRQLGAAIEARDLIASQMHEMKLEFQRIERENNAYRRETRDLGRQVQSLLREVETQRDPSFLDGELTVTNPEDEYDRTETDLVITKQLIVFRSVRELQEQNQRLVRLTRELSKRMETEEAESKKLKEESETGSMAVEEARKAIEMLREEVKSSKIKIETLTRERDMCRRMLSQTGRPDPLAGTPVSEMVGLSDPSTPGRNSVLGSDAGVPQSATNAMVLQYERMLQDLQKSFDDFRRETSTDQRTLQTQLDTAVRETSDYRVQLAKARSQIDMLNERYQILAQNGEMQTKELQELRKRGAALQDTIGKQDATTRQLLEELVAVRSKEDILRNEAANLRAEKKMHESMESRLLQENQSLMKERAHLNEVLTNLQNMQNELERSEGETARRIQSHAEALERELQTARARLAEESNASKTLILRKDADAKEYQSRIDKLTSDYQQSRETLIATQTSLEHTTTRVEDLTRQLQVAEEQLAVYQRKPSDGTSMQTREQQLETETVSLRSELKSARAEADQLRGHIEQFKSIAAANESALEQLNSTYDEYRAKTDAKITESEGQIRSLNETIQDLKSEMSKTVTDMTEMQNRMNEERENWNRERRRLEERVRELDSVEEKANAAQAAVHEDLTKQAAIAQEAQQKYEHELMMRAADVQTLANAKKELVDLRSEVNGYKAQAETAIANLRASEASWDNQKQLLERSLAELESKCKDLVDQNNILHSQLETVSAQALKIQQRANAPLGAVADNIEGGAGISNTDKSIDELRDVIRFVRREKEILAAQHELSMQEAKRLKQQLDHTSRALDEARALLTEERQREQASIQSAAQHTELLRKINQLNILRESNSTLRDENEKNAKRVQELEQKLKGTEAKVGPLTEEVRNLEAELESRKQELLTVEEDNKRWKTRTQQILQKYERIDPVELENLKTQVATLQETLDKTNVEKNEALKKASQLGNIALWKNQIQKEMKAKQQAETQLRQAQEEITGLQKQLTAVTSDRDSLSNTQQEMTNLQEELRQAREDADKKGKELTANKERYSSLLNRAKQQQQSLAAQQKQLVQLTEVTTEATNLKQELQQVREDFDNKDKEATKRYAMLLKIYKQHKARIEEKEKEIARLKQDLATGNVQPTSGEIPNATPEDQGAQPVAPTVDIDAVVNERLAQAQAQLAQQQQAVVEAAIKAKEAELEAKHLQALESQQQQMDARSKARMSLLENKYKKLEATLKSSSPGGSTDAVAAPTLSSTPTLSASAPPIPAVAALTTSSTPTLSASAPPMPAVSATAFSTPSLSATALPFVPSAGTQLPGPTTRSQSKQIVTGPTPVQQPQSQPQQTNAGAPPAPASTNIPGPRPIPLKRRRDEDGGVITQVQQSASQQTTAPVALKRRRPPEALGQGSPATESGTPVGVPTSTITVASGAGPVALKRRRPDLPAAAQSLLQGVSPTGSLDQLTSGIVATAGAVDEASTSQTKTTPSAVLDVPTIVVDQPITPQNLQEHADESEQAASAEQPTAVDLQPPHQKRRRQDEDVDSSAGSPSAIVSNGQLQPEQMPTPGDDMYLVDIPDSPAVGSGTLEEEQVWTASEAMAGDPRVPEEEFVIVQGEDERNEGEIEGDGTEGDGIEGGGIDGGGIDGGGIDGGGIEGDKNGEEETTYLEEDL